MREPAKHLCGRCAQYVTYVSYDAGFEMAAQCACLDVESKKHKYVTGNLVSSWSGKGAVEPHALALASWQSRHKELFPIEDSDTMNNGTLITETGNYKQLTDTKADVFHCTEEGIFFGEWKRDEHGDMRLQSSKLRQEEPEYAPHVERMIVEANELNTKIGKLTEFRKSIASDNLTAREQMSLEEQCQYMEQYLTVLSTRIGAEVCMSRLEASQ